MRYKQLVLLVAFIFLIGCCNKQEPAVIKNENPAKSISLDSIVKLYNNPSDKYVMVIAHRAAWRTFPENSIEAIRSAIKIGVDMVEVDIAKTKDGILILMHDDTVDRTTTGSGKVTDLTYNEIKQLRLNNAMGDTDYKVPTLMEALIEIKGKIMINLDRADEFFEEIYPMLKETNTIGQVVLKGHYTAEEMKAKFGDFYKEVLYMPLITDQIKDIKTYVDSHEAILNPSSYEIVFNENYLDSFEYIPEIQKNGDNVWINTLWGSLANNRTDDKAYWNPDDNWGWVVENGATMIQTDRPSELITYLKSIGKR